MRTLKFKTRKRKPVQKQHVQIYRKIVLRKRLIVEALPGAAYVPFIGDGDLAKLYLPEHPIFGADIDPKRVSVARRRFPSFVIVEADCNGWPFRGAGAEFSIADFDAYASPYKSFESFWRSDVPRTKRMVLFFTDGMRIHIRRLHNVRYPDGRIELLPGHRRSEIPKPDRRLEQRIYNGYLRDIVFPWFEELIHPWKIKSKLHYFREAMTYWGAVIENEN